MKSDKKVRSLSWKQKLDPAFDKFIKSFLTFLESWGLPASEGYINIAESEPHFNKIEKEGFPSFVPFYENYDFDNILQFVTKYSEAPASYEEIGNIFKAIERHEWGTDISEAIEKLMDKISGMSKDYYRKWDMIPNPDKDLKSYIHFVSDLISLQYHLVIIDKGKEDNQLTGTAVKIIQWAIFTAWNAISFTLNKQSLAELYEEAQHGHDGSLFKLIKLDKTLFDHEWVRKRIRQAAYSGDADFFSSIAKAIKDDPLKHRKIKIERHLVLMNFWFYGLYRLTIPELMQLLEDSGMTIQEDEVTFRKFIDREMRPHYQGLHSTNKK